MNKTEYYLRLSEQNKHKYISEADASDICSYCQSSGITIIDIESENYPDALRNIDDPPLVLFCIGDISLLKESCIAVVGTRRASPYGKWIANCLGREIAAYNAVHVSGMAMGIDAASHEAVLRNGGKSIAVLGTGIDVCYPKSSETIYALLKEKGLVISEYPPKDFGTASNFPRRNRIISGISEKVVIVEGSLKSGSMITARFAIEQGRDVFAVPGNINQANSIGPNLLIFDGAVPIVNTSEIAEILGLAD